MPVTSFSPMSFLKSPTQCDSWLQFLIMGWKSKSQESLRMKWNTLFLLENKWKSIIFKIHFENTGIVAYEQTKYFYQRSLQLYWGMIHKKLHIFNVCHLSLNICVHPLYHHHNQGSKHIHRFPIVCSVSLLFFFLWFNSVAQEHLKGDIPS